MARSQHSTGSNELWLGGVTLVAGAVTVGVTLAFRAQFELASARPLGLVVLYAGMALFIWAAVHLKSAIGGMLEPRLDRLVESGPYRIVRHPVYVGITVAMLGMALAVRSWTGLATVVLIFLPVELQRARLEERALARKFGETWHAYAARVGFFLPGIGRATGEASKS